MQSSTYMMAPSINLLSIFNFNRPHFTFSFATWLQSFFQELLPLGFLEVRTSASYSTLISANFLLGRMTCLNGRSNLSILALLDKFRRIKKASKFYIQPLQIQEYYHKNRQINICNLCIHISIYVFQMAKFLLYLLSILFRLQFFLYCAMCITSSHFTQKISEELDM